MSSAEAASLATDADRRSARLRAGSANPAFSSPHRARSHSRAPSVGSDDDVDAVSSGRPAGVAPSATGPSPAARGAAAASGSRPSPSSVPFIQLELDAARRQLAAQEQLLADQRAVFAQQQQLAVQQQAIASVHAENARLHARLAQANAHVPGHAPAAVSAVDAERLKLGLGSLDTLAATEAWRERFAIRADVTVVQVSAVVAALFHGLGSVPHAAPYRLLLHAVLTLPVEGEDVPNDGYMESAAGAQMAAKFGITARPTSPSDDHSSDSGSGSQSSAGALSRRRAADVTAITAALLGDTSDSPDLTRIHIIDAALHAALKRLTYAGPDTPEYEAVNLQSTFAAALSALLTCADHAELSIGQRTVARAFGMCPLYNRGGASIASLSVSQCARLVAKDAAARLQCLRALPLPHLAMQLALAAAPVGTENRGHFSRGVRKAANRAVPPTAADLAGLSSALDAVAAKYLNMPPTGIFTHAQPAELHQALFLPPVPPSTAAPAMPPAKGAPAESGARSPSPTAGQPRPGQPLADKPPPTQPPVQPTSDASRVPASPAEALAAIDAYIQAASGPVQRTACLACRPAAAAVPVVRTLQGAVTGLHRALVPAREDARWAGRLADPAHADAAAVSVNPVLGDADVVGAFVMPAGGTAGAAVPAAGLPAVTSAPPAPGPAGAVRAAAAPVGAVAAGVVVAGDVVAGDVFANGANAPPVQAPLALALPLVLLLVLLFKLLPWLLLLSLLLQLCRLQFAVATAAISSAMPAISPSPAPNAEPSIPPLPAPAAEPTMPPSPAPAAEHTMRPSPAPDAGPTMRRSGSPAPAAEPAMPPSPAPTAVRSTTHATARLRAPAPGGVAANVLSPSLTAHELAALDHARWCADLRAPPEVAAPAVAAAARALGRRPTSNRFGPLEDFPNVVPPVCCRTGASAATIVRLAAPVGAAARLPHPARAALARLPAADGAADATVVADADHAAAGVVANMPRQSVVSCPPVPAADAAAISTSQAPPAATAAPVVQPSPTVPAVLTSQTSPAPTAVPTVQPSPAPTTVPYSTPDAVPIRRPSPPPTAVPAISPPPIYASAAAQLPVQPRADPGTSAAYADTAADDTDTFAAIRTLNSRSTLTVLLHNRLRLKHHTPLKVNCATSMHVRNGCKLFATRTSFRQCTLTPSTVSPTCSRRRFRWSRFLIFANSSCTSVPFPSFHDRIFAGAIHWFNSSSCTSPKSSAL